MELDNDKVMYLLKHVGERGDKGELAMRELYRTFGRRIHSYVLHQIGDTHTAEEIVTETMFAVWKDPARYMGKAKFSTWLIGIARHKMLDAVRGRLERTENHEVLDDQLPCDELGPAELLEAKQRRERVQYCIDKLSRTDRECIRLYYYEGMSIREVASIQDSCEDSVKVRLFHARQRIKSYLFRIPNVAGICDSVVRDCVPL